MKEFYIIMFNDKTYWKDVKMRTSIVSINLKKDEIIIKLNENAGQKEIMEQLKKKITELKKLYKE